MTSTTAAPTGLFGEPRPDTTQFGYALDELCRRVPDVRAVVVVSSDGLLLAANRDLPTDHGDQIAAIVASEIGLSRGLSTVTKSGAVGIHVDEDDTVALDYLLVALSHATWLIMTARDVVLLAAAVSADGDPAVVAGELHKLGGRFADHITRPLHATAPA